VQPQFKEGKENEEEAGVYKNNPDKVGKQERRKLDIFLSVRF